MVGARLKSLAMTTVIALVLVGVVACDIPEPTPTATREVPTPTLIPRSTSTALPTPSATPLLPTTSPVPPTPTMVPGLAEVITGVETFLAARYDSERGLYSASPIIEKDNYWVYGDAYLAGVDISQYDVPEVTRWKVLKGKAIPEEEIFYGEYAIDLGNGVKTYVTDTSVVFYDITIFADRLCMAVINAQNAGNTVREEALRPLIYAMWDGKGMKDSINEDKQEYETFKTALYYWATGNETARRILLELQEQSPRSPHFGGFYTHYSPELEPFPWIDANIETTMITMLALRAR